MEMKFVCPKCNSDLDSKGRCTTCDPPSKSSSRVRGVIFFLVLILAGYAILGLAAYKINYPPWRQIINRLLDRTEIYEVRTDPPSFEVSQGRRPSLTIEDVVEFRRLFETRRFDRLEKKFDALQTSFEQDHSREYLIYDAWGTFNDIPPDQQQGFDEWIEHSPTHYAPYLARAFYFVKKGWKSRGGDWARDTSEEQFRGMRENFRLAMMDIDRALGINPRLLPAYMIRLSIFNAQGTRAEEDQVFAEARELYPDSFLLYSHFLNARRPRWGGSYAEMEKIARKALEQANFNPEMYLLFGKIYDDQAWYFWKDDKNEEAVELYAKALRFGQHFNFFEERARNYLRMKNLDQALMDINQAVSLRPVLESPYRLRATIHVHREDIQSARRDIGIAARLAPWNSWVQDWPDWAAGFLMRKGHDLFETDLSGAIHRYDQALEIDPNHAETLHWRGVAYSKLGQPEKALADVRRSLTADPSCFEANRMLDQLLAKKGQWDDIIASWDRFIALEPDNAGAYLERAGTYKHQGDMTHAMADLKKACELGSEKACGIQKRYR